ncbi:hypothetical protein ACFWY6_30200 [Streptomyces sp. NPDC059037]
MANLLRVSYGRAKGQLRSRDRPLAFEGSGGQVPVIAVGGALGGGPVRGR